MSLSLLEEWISKEYTEAFKSGYLHELYCLKQKYKFAILENFLLKEKFDPIVAHGKTIRLSKANTGKATRNANWYWGAYDNLDFVRFVYSQEFSEFICTLMNGSMIPDTKSVPQWNELRPGSPGLPIHNDFKNEKRGKIVSLLQASNSDDNRSGGELFFYDSVDGKFEVVKKVVPNPNTYIIFQINSESYHAVAPTKGEWNRRNISVDWLQGA